MKMVAIASSFLLGVLLFQTSRELPSAFCLLWLPATLLLGLKYSRTLPLFIGSLGYVWSYLFALLIIYPQLASELEGENLQITGSVVEVKSQSKQYTQFTFYPDKRSIREWNSRIPEKIALSWYRPAQIIHSDQVCQFVVRLKRHWRYANPGSIDREKYMFVRGISARGYVRSGQCHSDEKIATKVLSLRQQWIFAFSAISSDYQYSNLMEALTFGYRDNINQNQWQVLRETGTSHLLAISGLHLSAISFVVFFIASRLARCSAWVCERMPAQCIGAIFAMVAAVFYAYLAGFSLPTQRALIMVSVGLVAILLRKPVVNFAVFSTALLVVLVINPLAVLSAGFWMSFLAVLFIFIILKCTENRSKAMRIILVQCYLGAALFPISLLFFSQASLISPLVNLLAIPAVSFILLPLLLFTQILFLLNIAISLSLFEVLDHLFAWLWWCLQQSANYQYASFEFYPTLFGVLAYELGLFMLILPKDLPARKLAWIFLPAVFLIREPALQSNQMRVTILDVGQGLSVVVETAHHSLVYDAGPRFLSGFNTGSAVVLPYLRSRGIKRVDLGIVSHNDNDHAGGMHSLIEDKAIDRLMVSNHADLYSPKPAKLCRVGDQWSWDGVIFKVLHPSATWQSNDNNRSCVLQIIHPAGVVLLTGDIENSAEKSLVDQYGDKLASDLIIVPHHGSKSSSSYRLLNRVRPQTAVFSVGYRNKYGFPHATIMQRYQELGTQLVDTIEEGAVTFLFDSESGLQKQTGYRLQHKRYWHSTMEELTDSTE